MEKNTDFEVEVRARKAKNSTDDSAQSLYLAVKNIPLLLPEEEVELGKKIQAGLAAVKEKKRRAHRAGRKSAAMEETIAAGAAAKSKLVRHNIRLVFQIAGRYNRGSGHLKMGDYVHEGVIGLHKAADKFDWQRGYRFSTYASWWIRSAINRALADTSRTVRLPVHIFDRLMRLLRAKKLLTQNLGRNPLPEEIAKATGIGLKKVRQLLELPQDSASLDELTETHEKLESEEAVTGGIDKDDKVAMLAHIMEKTYLSDRDKDIINLRFADDKLTLAKIGKKYGISRERIRQLQKETLKRLRATALRLGYSRGDLL